MKRASFRSILTIGLTLTGAAFAADPKPAKPSTKPASKPAATQPTKDDWLAPMDYGPFLSTSVARPGGKLLKNKTFQSAIVPKFPIDLVPDMIANKGIVIPVGPKDAKGQRATVCFDTDTLAMSGWTGGWLDLAGTMFTNHKGTSQVTLAGTEQFHTSGPGWGGGKDGTDANDPRKENIGPLPETWGRYGGLYVAGETVVLRYRVGTTEVYETPSAERSPAGDVTFVRTFQVAAHESPMTLFACDFTEGNNVFADDKLQVLIGGPKDGFTSLEAIGDVAGCEFRKIDQPSRRIGLYLPASAKERVLEITIRHSAKGIAAATQPMKTVDPKSLAAGGPAHWKPITTTGKPGTPASGKVAKKVDPAFIVDTLTLPESNPYNAWFRLTGLDFFSDGRAALSTINGDVWIVSGIDDKLDHLIWTRFATGLYQPMGLKILNDVVYVRGRDQITRLHDLNQDGEADYYENFSNEGVTHPSYHGFVFDLQADTGGNLYYARGGLGMEPTIEGHGRLMKLSNDGKTATPIATGLRAPNGMGEGPNGWITVSDNQGNWIPSSKIHLVDPSKPPAFLGYLPHHHQSEQPKEPARPLLYVPYKMDNSSGGQAVITSPAWGPYQGQWIHTSFGAACTMLILPDDATKPGEMPAQAAVVRLPLDFATGIMRPRFNPKDGQLYVAGVGGGWQTKGTADGGFYRVRHTGKPGFAPTRFAVVPGGVRLTFAQPLDKKEATDVQNYGVEQWNYAWTEKYGSPDFSPKDPKKAGHDMVEVKAVTLSEDGKSVTLQIPGMVPVDQMLIQVNLTTAEGADFQQEVYATINRVP